MRAQHVMSYHLIYVPWIFRVMVILFLLDFVSRKPLLFLNFSIKKIKVTLIFSVVQDDHALASVLSEQMCPLVNKHLIQSGTFMCQERSNCLSPIC